MLSCRYPQLVAGAVASSAPLVAKEDIGSSEFMAIVGRSIRREGGDRCWGLLHDATAAMAGLLAKGAQGEAELAAHFQTCEPMSVESRNAATLVRAMMSKLLRTVQANHVYPPSRSTALASSSSLSDAGDVGATRGRSTAGMSTISIMCDLMVNASRSHGNALDALMILAPPLQDQHPHHRSSSSSRGNVSCRDNSY